MRSQERLEHQRQRNNIWAARVIPILLAGFGIYATYVLVGPLCIDYLLHKHDDKEAAIAILITYFLLFLIVAPTFLRLVILTIFDPPYLPLGHAASQNAPSFDDPNSPGLDKFYRKDIFICEMDGKPKWCSECAAWKPDRTHHSSDCGRCIYRMDHFCPWVGGPLGETNFKFFIQFTFWGALWCIHMAVVMAIYVHRQIENKDETLNVQFAVLLGFCSLFGIFTAGMTGVSMNSTLRNVTQVEDVRGKRYAHTVALRKPPDHELLQINPRMARELSYPEITYPLSTTKPAQSFDTETDGASISPRYVRLSKPIRPPETIQPPESTPTLPDIEPTRHNLSADGQSMLDTKVFAVLKMNLKENPWDLGSPLLNWETVMGTSVIDWLLPIKRSPCCSHDDPESHYLVGSAVDRLRAGYYFMNSEDIRARGGRKRFESNDKSKSKEKDEQPKTPPRSSRSKKHSRRHSKGQSDHPRNPMDLS